MTSKMSLRKWNTWNLIAALEKIALGLARPYALMSEREYVRIDEDNFEDLGRRLRCNSTFV